MKNYIVYILALLVFSGCGNKTEKGFRLTAKVKGIDTGWVKLISPNLEDRSQKTVDSTRMVNGQFEMSGKVAVPEMMTIQIEPGGWSFNVFVENQPLEIQADTTGAVHYDYTAYGGGKFAHIKNYTEKGSANFDAWTAFDNDPGQKPFGEGFEQLNKKFDAAGKDIDAQYAVRDEMDSLKRKQQIWQKQWINTYLEKHPDEVAGPYMFYQVYRFSNQMPYEELNATLNKFGGEAKSSVYYKALDQSRTKLKAVQVGEVAPDFTLLKRDSTKFTLSSVRGQYVMLDFWASWCHPCREAIPHWKSVYQKYHEKGLEIVSISDDNKWDMWVHAMDVEKMPWTQTIDEFPVKGMPAKVISQYMINAIPHYLLLDKQGKILISTPDEHLIDEKLAGLFGS